MLLFTQYETTCLTVISSHCIGVGRGPQGDTTPQIFRISGNFAERRYPKENTVARLKSSILVPQIFASKKFGLAAPLSHCITASPWGGRCLHVALPVAAFLEILTKFVNLRATAATACVQHGVGHQTPFSGRGSRNAVEDLRPNILQLNTEGLAADKISVIEQLAYKNKAFIIVLQETHCTPADKLVIPNFSLAGSILSRNHGLATFVHERLEWSLVDQSPEQSETE